MQTTTFLAIITAMASAAVASPASPAISKRDYATGQCGIHIYQTQRTNDDDWVEWVIKDANGDQIGHWTGGLANAEPQNIQTNVLPDIIYATQPTESHDIDMTYQDQSFGTEGGCSVGKWDDGTRQWDCGFAC